jgi:hypothetical protein
MRRRRFVQTLAGTLGFLPVRSWRAWAQTVRFPGPLHGTLEKVAITVLPASLGNEGVLAVVRKFEHWVQDYRPGADTEHGYGVTRVIPLPASPAPTYLAQLRELKPLMDEQDLEKRKASLRKRLDAANIKELTPLPRGKHVVADLMSFYFHSSDANDLCYQAAIERYRCRGLEHSEKAPPPMRQAS